MYDPCGTQKLEGDDIIKRLAKYLNVDAARLQEALIVIAKSDHIKAIYDRNEKGE
jgi:energy-converting hydrogenase A subunit M